MAKIKLLTSLAGIDFSHNAGDIIDCNDAEAKRYIDAGFAEPIETASKVEKATAKRNKVETAVQKD
jgi:hypothetical protein